MARYEPETVTGRMNAARRHRKRAFGERNEVIGVLARLWPSHVMPVTSHLTPLSAGRVALCIHSPAGLLCWIITEEEAVDEFPTLDRIGENHWDRSTRKIRSERLAQIGATPIVTDPNETIQHNSPSGAVASDAEPAKRRPAAKRRKKPFVGGK